MHTLNLFSVVIHTHACRTLILLCFNQNLRLHKRLLSSSQLEYLYAGEEKVHHEFRVQEKVHDLQHLDFNPGHIATGGNREAPLCYLTHNQRGLLDERHEHTPSSAAGYLADYFGIIGILEPSTLLAL